MKGDPNKGSTCRPWRLEVFVDCNTFYDQTLRVTRITLHISFPPGINYVIFLSWTVDLRTMTKQRGAKKKAKRKKCDVRFFTARRNFKKKKV